MEEKTEPSKPSKVQVMKAIAVQQAMHEICTENRAEIIKRAKQKLIDMGVKFKIEIPPEAISEETF